MKHPFRWLLGGQAISALGSQVTFMALPLIAVTLLDSNPLHMGILGALDNLPYLLFGLFVGSLVDRRRRRPLMITSDLLRALAVLTIPVAFLVGGITFTHLCLVAFAVGLGNLVFDVACQAQMPDIVGEDGDLVQANGALQTTSGIASLTAPGLVGVFIATVGAPLAMLIDAFSYLISAASLRMIGPDSSTATADATVWEDVKTGVGSVVRDNRLLGLTGAGAAVSLGMNAAFSVLMVFLARELHVSTIGIGLVFLAIALLGATGALTANHLAKAVGAGRVLLWGPVVAAVGLVCMALAGHVTTPLLLIYLGAGLCGWGIMTSQALAAGLRQAFAPEEIRGRVLGTMRFVEWGIMPVGALLGGFAGQLLGVAPAVAFSGALVATGSVWVLTTGLARLRSVPIP